MKTDTHKDWTDAFRECFPEEVRPADGGWEAVSGRMRRAAARKRTAIIAAVLALPLAGGVFFSTRQPSSAPAPIAVTTAPVQADAIPYQDAPILLADVPATVPSAPAAGFYSPSAVPVSPTVIPDEAEDLSPTDPKAGPQPPQESIPTEQKEYPVTPDDSPVILGEAMDLPGLPDDGLSESLRKTRRPHRISLGVSANAIATNLSSSNVSAVNSPGTNNPFNTKSNGSYSNSLLSYNSNLKYLGQPGVFKVHDPPVGLGLTLQYGLTDRIALESGLEYTYLHSYHDGPGGTQEGAVDVRMDLIGIPLRMNVTLLSAGRYDLYAGIGGKVDKCLSARYGGQSVRENSLQWSGSVLLGVQRSLSRNSYVFLQPDITYCFTDTELVTYRSDNPLTLSIHAGLRFRLNH